MPFNSKELLQYFNRAGIVFGIPKMDPKEDCLSLAALDPHALRSTLVIAGMHYSWNTGNMQAYSSAFFFHKIQSIRAVNDWLEKPDPKLAALCVRQISTLIFIEATLGNLAAAETHLDGLMAFLDVQEQQTVYEESVGDTDRELADRYLILIYSFVHTLKSRLSDFIRFHVTPGEEPNLDSLSTEDTVHCYKSFHKLEKGGMEKRLKAIRLFPHFFSIPPQGRMPQDIDSMAIIDCLRDITEAVDRRHIDSTGNKAEADRVWSEGGLTRLLVAFVVSHLQSFSEKDPKTHAPEKEERGQQVLLSSWNGIAAPAGIYIRSVIDLANASLPVDHRVLRRSLLLLKRDVEQTSEDVRATGDKIRGVFWFWKAFTAALSVARAERELQGLKTRKNRVFAASDQVIRELRALRAWFESCLETWSKVTAITDWAVAKASLGRIVWPCALPPDKERLAKTLWDNATAGGLDAYSLPLKRTQQPVLQS